jgi:hypothetical protein
MPGEAAHIEQCVEEICALGCRAVTMIIRDWEKNRPLAVMALSETAQQQVLIELQSIMAVYDRAGSCTL